VDAGDTLLNGSVSGWCAMGVSAAG
jgi:hypothetical protein